MHITKDLINEKCHFTVRKLTTYCIHVDVFRFKLHSNNISEIAFPCIFLNILRKTVFCLKEMVPPTMSLDSLFLSLLISRPAAEKIRSDGMDVEGHAWQSLRF